jgi:hypothetical protein
MSIIGVNEDVVDIIECKTKNDKIHIAMNNSIYEILLMGDEKRAQVELSKRMASIGTLLWRFNTIFYLEVIFGRSSKAYCVTLILSLYNLETYIMQNIVHLFWQTMVKLSS